MRKNLIKKTLAEGGRVVNGWCSIPSSYSAELMAHQGFDSVTIDL
jgi:4-hydroxy-2-oxoheptanedioate aldolase